MKKNIKNVDSNNCSVGQPIYDAYGYMIGCLEVPVSNSFQNETNLYSENINDENSSNPLPEGKVYHTKNIDKTQLIKGQGLEDSTFSYIGNIKINNQTPFNDNNIDESENVDPHYRININVPQKYNTFYIQVKVNDHVERVINFSDQSDTSQLPECNGTSIVTNCKISSQGDYRRHFANAFLRRGSNQISFVTHDTIAENFYTYWFKVEFNTSNDTTALKIFPTYQSQVLKYDSNHTSETKTYLGKRTSYETNDPNVLKEFEFSVYGILTDEKINYDQIYNISTRIEESLFYEDTALIDSKNIFAYRQGFVLSKSYTNESFTYTTGLDVEESKSNSYCLSHDENLIHRFNTGFVSEVSTGLEKGVELTQGVESGVGQIAKEYISTYNNPDYDWKWDFSNENSEYYHNNYDILIASVNYLNDRFILIFDNESEGNLFTTFYEEVIGLETKLNWIVFKFNSNKNNEGKNIEVVQKWSFTNDDNNSFMLDYDRSLLPGKVGNYESDADENSNANSYEVTMQSVYGFRKTDIEFNPSLSNRLANKKRKSTLNNKKIAVKQIASQNKQPKQQNSSFNVKKLSAKERLALLDKRNDKGCK